MMEVLGNGQKIADKDMTPSAVDHKDFGNVCLGNLLIHTFTLRNTSGAVLTCEPQDLR
ncbi:MAG: hypothetical protein ACETWQ_22965 [Phycisphaerae bacterium]